MATRSGRAWWRETRDRKSTRLNSSHSQISYAVFCLKKKSYGLVAFGSSLDQIGVFGRSVHDAARVLSVISGRDPRDATCEDRDPLRLPTVPESLQGFVIGLPREYFPAELDPAVRRACERAVRLMKEQGAAVREVSLPHTAYAVPTYYVLAPAEASSNLARYDGVRYGPQIGR